MSTAPVCDFFIIGAAKAGTTSLHARLQAHPDLFLTEPKEPEFFARDDRYEAGIDSYAALFTDAKPGQLRGDASTLYSLAPLFPKTAERIKTHCPEAKFIYMLREPVNRAVDHNRTVAQSQQIRGLMRRLGPVAALRHLVPNGLRQKLRARALARMPQGTAKTHVPQPMRPQTAAKLAEEFYADFDRLETLTGLDLKTAWGRGANG
ncbi:hypothetical protein DI396_15600 [Litorivita pollutaquae]|uniref:Sulfotransferase family protein n=1 Tax=Litorivita pollutaquae TaxID=2200892 RepID=A0A2V4MIH6_9RHOB|nr:hypothetical protein [Litorivita pollutaquae]PYC46421.1 hypothetical protein DI396_15600 [Litorivita pollutaquae]